MAVTLESTPEINPTTTRRVWWAIPVLVAVVALLGILGYALIAKDRTQVVSGPAPDFTLTTFEGEQVTLSAFQGKPVVINFWASWCVECDKEMAMLEAMHQRYGDEVVFIGIDYLDTEPKAREYLAQYGTSYINGQDLGGRISNDYNIKGVPETFFIAADGTIQGLKIGPLTESELQGWMDNLLAQPVGGQ